MKKKKKKRKPVREVAPIERLKNLDLEIQGLKLVHLSRSAELYDIYEKDSDHHHKSYRDRLIEITEAINSIVEDICML